MARVTGLTKSLDLPGGGQAFIRKLSWKQLKAAAKAQSTENVAAMKEMGAEILQAFRDPQRPEEGKKAIDRAEEIQKAQSRKASSYDRELILKAGVVSIDGEAQDDLVEALDPVSAEFLHEAIVEYAFEVPGKNG